MDGAGGGAKGVEDGFRDPMVATSDGEEDELSSDEDEDVVACDCVQGSTEVDFEDGAL